MPEVEPRHSRYLPSSDALRARLRGWWHGRPRNTSRRAGDAGPAPADAPAHSCHAEQAAPGVFWTADRIGLAQQIWGREHVAPGGDDYVTTLLKPLGLDPSMSLLEIGAGLGAATRVMHRRFGVWPKSFEPDPALVEAAMSLSIAAGLGKKAPVAQARLDGIEVRANGFDRVILRDVCHLAGDKAALIRAAATGLRRRGQILVTDFVLAEARARPPVTAVWAAGEPSPSSPWSWAELTDCLSANGLRIHIAEDESLPLRARILDGWAMFQPALLASAPAPEWVQLALLEGERWQRCVVALDAGALRHIRIIASRP